VTSMSTMSTSTRYYQLFIPSIRLVSSMVTSLPTNGPLRHQAAILLDKHSSTLEKILDEANRASAKGHFAPSVSHPKISAAMQAAELITGLVALLEQSPKDGSGREARRMSLRHHYDFLVKKMCHYVRDLWREGDSKTVYYHVVKGTEPDNITLKYEITRNILLILASRSREQSVASRNKENARLGNGGGDRKMGQLENRVIIKETSLKLEDLIVILQAMLRPLPPLKEETEYARHAQERKIQQHITEMTLQLIFKYFQNHKVDRRQENDLKKQLGSISHKNNFVRDIVRRIEKEMSF